MLYPKHFSDGGFHGGVSLRWIIVGRFMAVRRVWRKGDVGALNARGLGIWH
jgi:hypothetical protein